LVRVFVFQHRVHQEVELAKIADKLLLLKKKGQLGSVTGEQWSSMSRERTREDRKGGKESLQRDLLLADASLPPPFFNFLFPTLSFSHNPFFNLRTLAFTSSFCPFERAPLSVSTSFLFSK
jgi:hypothetical protein